MNLDSRIKVSVVGLGYVGLPLVLEMCHSGNFNVTGIDIDGFKVEKINEGKSPIDGVSDSQIAQVVNEMNFKAFQNFSVVSESQVVIVCVPTPLNSSRLPDLTFVEKAAIDIAPYIRKHTLVILESTVYPGATRNLFSSLLEKHCNLSLLDFYVAFSPERIDPGNIEWGVKNTPKLVAGLSIEARKLAYEFYSKFIDTVVACDTLEVAEMAKLLENSFRLINISFINELAWFCNQLGVDVNKVIKASSTKPYGFMPFYPSLGAGGHCIPVDPLYLSNSARNSDSPLKMIELAAEINDKVSDNIILKSERQLGGLSKKRVLVVGIAYKPNIADTRESAALNLITKLRQKGATVAWHDDLVKNWNGEYSIPISNSFDIAIIATQHDSTDLSPLGKIPVINSRGSV